MARMGLLWLLMCAAVVEKVAAGTLDDKQSGYPAWRLEAGIGLPTTGNEYDMPAEVLDVFVRGWAELLPWIAVGLGIDGGGAPQKVLRWGRLDLLIDAHCMYEDAVGVGVRTTYGIGVAAGDLRHDRSVMFPVQSVGAELVGILGTPVGRLMTGPQVLFHLEPSWSYLAWATLQWLVSVEF